LGYKIGVSVYGSIIAIGVKDKKNYKNNHKDHHWSNQQWQLHLYIPQEVLSFDSRQFLGTQLTAAFISEKIAKPFVTS